MPNAKPGDHPLSDCVLHGLPSLPPRITKLLRAHLARGAQPLALAHDPLLRDTVEHPDLLEGILRYRLSPVGKVPHILYSSAPDMPHVWADVTIVTPEQGGRHTPFRVGYRPQLHFPDVSSDWVTRIDALDPDPMPPGGRGTMALSVLAYLAMYDRLEPGKEFFLREGDRIVATGTVLRRRTLRGTVE